MNIQDLLPDNVAPPATAAVPSGRIGILYENAAWLEDLFEHLAARELAFDRLYLDDAANVLDQRLPYTLLINRVSPSAYMREHHGSIRYALAFMDTAISQGIKIINGPKSFRHETSKVAQHLLMKQLGVRTPLTAVFNSCDRIRDLAKHFPFPAILKPDTGGSGAFVRRVDSVEHLEHILCKQGEVFAPDHLLLLQSYIPSRDGSIVRTEFVDGEFIYAMRVTPTNTFNLCPADACVRTPANSTLAAAPSVEFVHYEDIPAEAVAQAREIIRAAQLDVGGVEYIETEHGQRYFYDINATSMYRPEICEQAGVDGIGKFIDFVEREFLKENAKHGPANTLNYHI